MMKKPLSVYMLSVLVLFQALSGLFGGAMLVISPSGSLLHMPASEMLSNSPFGSFLVPGLILLVLLGIFPLIVFAALLLKPEPGFAGKLNIYKNRHWAWTYSLYTAVMLILWIDFEILFLGGGHLLQTIYGLLGVAILVAALLPPVQRYYEKADGER